MTIRSFLLGVSVFGTFLFGAVSPVLAQEITPTVTPAKGRRTEAVCRVATNRIDNRVSRFNENKDRHLNRYNQLKTHFIQVADRLDARGYNTQTLRQDMKTLDDKLTKLAGDYKIFIDKLTESKAFACGHSEGEFKQVLTEARDLLKVVRADAKDIREFVHTTIQQDIRDLRGQKHPTSTPTPSV